MPSPLLNLSETKKLELCMDAKSFVFPEEPDTIRHVFGAKLHWITYSDYTGIYSIAICCLSVPTLYLRYGDSEKQIWIMKRESKTIMFFFFYLDLLYENTPLEKSY